MNTGPEFFEFPSVRRILERAALGAGVPLSVHPFLNGREGSLVASWGGCAACKHVNSLPIGERACRQSRRAGSMLAVSQDTPSATPCHMGFGLVSITPRMLPGFVLTFGPYCPASESRGLEREVCADLSELLGEEIDVVPFALNDLHRTPKGAVSAVAEWTAEALNTELARLSTLPPDPMPVSGRAKKQTIHPGFHPAHEEVAVALFGGVSGPARDYLHACLDEAGERASGTRRAGAVSTAVSRLLDVCRHAGADLDEAWSAFARFSAEAPGQISDKALIDAALKVLGTVAWSPGPAPSPKRSNTTGRPESIPDSQPTPVLRLGDANLNRILLPRITERVPLSEVAAQMGVSPSAVTHRLQRRFGLSYSEYLGRLRAEKAKELLRRTGLGMADVAERVGISDPSNLGRLFRRHVGMSPNEYRSRYGRKK